MEVISYVGFNNNRHEGLLTAAAKHFTAFFKRNNSSDFFISNFTHTLHREPFTSFKIKKHTINTKKSYSFRSFLAAAGNLVSKIQQNTTSIVKISALVCILFFIFSSIFILFSYFNNHTGQIKLFSPAKDELEILNKVMQSFALDEAGEYSDDGTLTGAYVSSASFTQPVIFSIYKVRDGDTISGITKKFGLKNISTLIAVNDIDNVRQLSAGQKLKVPSIDGLIYTVQSGNSLASLSVQFGVSIEELLDVNELDSERLNAGQQLFIPGAKLDSQKLQQALGTLFKIPIFARYRISSPFGYRADPFTGAKSFHTGVDLACPSGTPVVSAASGTVSFVGYSNVFGNYIIVKHSNGYQTLYGHLSKILAGKGQHVSQGTRIGLVGSTGYSTGPHLHFTIFKNGKLIDPMMLIKK